MKHAVKLHLLAVIVLTSNTVSTMEDTLPTATEAESVTISDKGLDLIKQFEGFRSHPYLDAGGVPTIGYGTIVYPDGNQVTMSDAAITQDQALDYLRHNVTQKCESVTKMLLKDVSQNQFDALCSFAYNLGVTALYNSTLLKLVNKGDYDAAANEFSKWTHDNGKVIPGLLVRREAEEKLFTGEIDVAQN